MYTQAGKIQKASWKLFSEVIWWLYVMNRPKLSNAPPVEHVKYILLVHLKSLLFVACSLLHMEIKLDILACINTCADLWPLLRSPRWSSGCGRARTHSGLRRPAGGETDGPAGLWPLHACDCGAHPGHCERAAGSGALLLSGRRIPVQLAPGPRLR